MRIVAMSDLHGKVLPEAVPVCDVLVIAGDICPDNRYTARPRYGRVCAEKQRVWLDEVFIPWLRVQHGIAQHIVLIWGNHDFIGDYPDLWPEWPQGVTLLHDSGIEIDGVAFWGTPWTDVPGHRWALDQPDYLNAKHYEKMSMAPMDVLISHGPAKGFVDRVLDGESVGSAALLRTIEQCSPLLHLCGHIHEARGGVWHSDDGQEPLHLNVAAVDVCYVPRTQPWMEIELDIVNRQVRAK